MSIYIIRQVGSRYELAKFEDHNTPTDIYSIWRDECNCPGAYKPYTRGERKPCKHTEILKRWLDYGDDKIGMVYDSETDSFFRMFKRLDVESYLRSKT